MRADADIAVIGGGPGGSTVATLLARAGWKVVLFEKERFPREHVGESLLPASLPVLEDLGVLPAVEAAGFLQKWGATMVWGTSREPWSWYFKETNQRFPHAYQVWRPTFDHLLLQNAVANGVDVREGHRALDVLFEGGRACGVRVANDGEDAVQGAAFVVDASGQAGLLGRALQLREPDADFRNLAVYGYFDGAQRLPEPDQGNIFIESYPDGWAWGIPLHTGWMSVGVVVDSAAGQKGIRAKGVRAFYDAQLAMAPRLGAMLGGATFVDGPHVIRDWSYVSERVAGPGWVLVGDAACFVDPLFSSGVHLALTSGVLAAAHVTTALRRPEMEEATGTVYQQLYYRQYHHFRELARLFYSSNRSVESYFWEARRIAGGMPDEGPRQSFIRAVAGQPPQGYERAVLGQGVLPESFALGVAAIEEERRRRHAEMERLAAGPGPAAWPPREAVPVPAAGARIERKPVLGDGEFDWGYVLISPAEPEGVEVSVLVATLMSLVDGHRRVCDILAEVADRVPAAQREAAMDAAAAALRILYVDGTIAGMRGL
ncbi:MAG: hypothetical protein Kow0010_24850 [Dehalococcoidia bacterium]